MSEKVGLEVLFVPVCVNFCLGVTVSTNVIYPPFKVVLHIYLPISIKIRSINEIGDSAWPPNFVVYREFILKTSVLYCDPKDIN